jgi:ribosomal-protein-alanine N-acetyltransferase
MLYRTCHFQTDRLVVKGWHSPDLYDGDRRELAQTVADMLTEPVTRSLPTHWQGDYTVDRARRWIDDRDTEGTTLLVMSKSNQQAVGLMILSEGDPIDGSSGMEVRLGYLLAESAWGQGLASELVEGLVGWCRGQATIASIVGGIESANAASRRVLEKNGFRSSDLVQERGAGEEFLRLSFRS